MTGSALVLRGDAAVLPLPDASVDLVVTSPPYFALRSYTDNGQHYDGQIGAESTPAEYIANLIDCTREWMRVLKPGGSIWVNLGDKYAQDTERSRNGHGGNLVGTNPLRSGAVYSGRRENDAPRKSLMMLPERYRIAAVDQLGLIARAVVIWSKPNGLPESVTDRVRRSHEDWVHLTKAPRYFSTVDEIREQHARRWTPGRNGGTRPALVASSSQYDGLATSGPNPLGKLPGSVWEIATEPLKVPDSISHAKCCNGAKREGCEDGLDHYAAFPTEWPRQIILGWSPSGICTVCGEGRQPVVRESLLTAEGERLAAQRGAASVAYSAAVQSGAPGASFGKRRALSGTELRKHTDPAVITGYTCACTEPTAPTRPAVVLDPFGGTGTTALVARALGRVGITVDMSADYCRLAAWRTSDRAQLAKAMRVEKPPVQFEGQGAFDLFGELAS